MIGLVDVAWFNDAAAAAIRWTAEALDADARDYLAGLPERREESNLTAVHGSPRDPIWEYITSPAVAAAIKDPGRGSGSPLPSSLSGGSAWRWAVLVGAGVVAAGAAGLVVGRRLR